MDRRTFVRGSLAGTIALTAGLPAWASEDAFAALEKRHGGRLGVAVLDTATGERMAYREDERFPMCSVFKLLAGAAVLHNVDTGSERIDRWVSYGSEDLLEYAPITRANIGKGGMTIGDLCAAAIELSDNTAGNLILKSLGGPEAATRYLRSLNDPITRMDRFEPDVNTCVPGDPRDTTTPAAMLADLNVLIAGTALSPTSRATLMGWLNNCKTAARRIPAGLPSTWKSGDKTASGANNTANDVAVIQRPNKTPLFIAAFFTGSSNATGAERDGVLADVGRIVARRLEGA